MIMRRGVGQSESVDSTFNPIGQATETRAVTMADGSVIGMEFDKMTGEPISTWQVAPPGTVRGGSATATITGFVQRYWAWLAGGLAIVLLLPGSGNGGRRRR